MSSGGCAPLTCTTSSETAPRNRFYRCRTLLKMRRPHVDCPGLWYEQLLERNVQRFRGGLVFKAHRRLHHSTLGLRVIKKKQDTWGGCPAVSGAFDDMVEGGGEGAAAGVACRSLPDAEECHLLEDYCTHNDILYDV